MYLFVINGLAETTLAEALEFEFHSLVRAEQRFNIE